MQFEYQADTGRILRLGGGHVPASLYAVCIPVAQCLSMPSGGMNRCVRLLIRYDNLSMSFSGSAGEAGEDAGGGG